MEVDRLRSLPIFSDLSDEELLRLSEICQTTTVSEDKVLMIEDEYAHKFFVILKGSASVWRQGQRIAQLGPGDLFGEMGLLTSGRRTATVTAESEMELMLFNEWDLQTLEKEWPTVGERIRKSLQERS